MRADLFLSQNGYAKSRSNARTLIEGGVVFADGRCVKKASAELSDGTVIEIKGDVCPFVSRGGLKLQGALEYFGLDVGGAICLDVGASTGGFTDCLLQNGASAVYAVDCGHGQLDKALSEDKRVINIEGINARDMTGNLLPEKVDVCTMDVSFISQILIHPTLPVLLKNGALYITLIKPQFEVGRANIGKNGIVKSEKAIKESIECVCESAVSLGFEKIGVCDSPVLGGDGNREYIGVFRFKGQK